MKYGIGVLLASICFGVYAQGFEQQLRVSTGLEELRVSKTFSSLRPITITLQQGYDLKSVATFKRNTDKLFSENEPLFYQLNSKNPVWITATFTPMINPFSKETSEALITKQSYNPKDLQGKELVIDLQKNCDQDKPCLTFTLRNAKKSRSQHSSGGREKAQPSLVGKKTQMSMPVAKAGDNGSRNLTVSIVQAGAEAPYSKVVFREAIGETSKQKSIKLPIAETATVAQAQQDLQKYSISTYDADNMYGIVGNEVEISSLLKRFARSEAKMRDLAIGVNQHNMPSFMEKRHLSHF